MSPQNEEREKATVTLPSELKHQAKEEGSMSGVIEKSLRSYFKESELHYVNTNARHVEGDGTKIYDDGVVATYGQQRFGDFLKSISVGDGVISYVSDKEVDYEGGARAVGIALAQGTGKEVLPSHQVYDMDHKEYHVPVKWLGVLDESNTVTPAEIRTITGRKTPQRTFESPAGEYQPGMKLLAEVILGRTILSDLL